MQNKEYFVIEGLAGSKEIAGSIEVNGSKNAVLPMMAASLLYDSSLVIENCPDIEDIKRMSELLGGLGVTVDRTKKGSVVIEGQRLSKSILDAEISKRMRASIFLIGPILGRMGEVTFPHPGGCVIGARPIDLFIDGYLKMGAELKEDENFYTLACKDGKLHGAEITFKFQSVGATETFMLSALLAKGITILRNCAIEPEVTSMALHLIKSGAKINGAGTTTLIIEGGDGALLHSDSRNVYQAIPDRLEAGSFLILGAIAASKLKIEKCDPEHLSVPIEILRSAGADIEIGKDFLVVKAVPPNVCRSISVKTHEYPGFPTDLQAPLTVLISQCCGEGTIFETIYEGRLNYTADLMKMGADIKMWDAHHVTIKGPNSLKGRELEGPDIRAGIAFIIAAIVAKGQSVIRNAYYIDRGYEQIEERLRKIGVNIKRVSA
ncbi:MAG: UDP-N-acetylglucosamine 1-carboxyvinyltransferase [Candidatus Taylorbacteria bacterium RIFCSPLOWO2_02_FULL_43_11]|uniref:UDP-N-acetylglucosamine 1-carboxyvinyltransferase n=1 Tax=Candidatus Taylorbacteria bacterium RIFCSPHIGHO2_02_FULL_43_32b TaxID=1802306 RepID=A0A1G2MI58_9BACT|nr:MAG: UDP-N-acetylglucosamine 1-carboxyvinyltransferase [Candidatus Taylorbacteria bacterium RIFCSPHIGHO2_01_FULL_43_47]OHA23533.1 MAG: UDP-N-acetylglucosamine 1-carboxyvinyltransferase [Candidatus Taylorbacteria bacterium RIFCSPHIGHO2_02_FULL_43_32b]OHA30535.1 MAG: UDP-N-acetylglucosamine 1-carboxyvinyltransferase [Candidatus Taylorbacteria bacterium RIFCSPLOWO2_01_FULL_43_44]OHA37096.1 MAG: UDP-N-acetylglucosamine 1-carboxyvinyltransferase [Candidatus Taylorbacteria bacterium RIFCSPLOWO2_02_